MFHNFIVLSIYTTIMSGNLKRKRCAYDTNFKLKVIQYSDECKNNRETYDDMLTTEQMIQMLEEEDSDEEFLGFD